MLIYVLLTLVLMQLIGYIKNQSITWESILEYSIPYWKQGTHTDKALGIGQMIMIGVVSFLKAAKASTLLEALIIFLFIFISFVWGIKLLLCVIEWLQEYIYTMTINIVFTMIVPLIIMMNLNHIDTDLEIQVCFLALLMSIVIVYMELISLVLGRGYHKEVTRYLKINYAVKLKSILTWFFIILLNLYTLLLFIQFYMGVEQHHFIEAEHFNKASAVDLFYYLVVTFTTVGFGDISPHTLLAKLISSLIALSGMIFTGVFVGCILNLKE